MAVEDELKSWIKTLTPSEKRFINLIGKARAGSGSQMLELFNWLNKAGEGEAIPAKASFRTNMPTLVVRLRELLLDSLRLLHKENGVNAVLQTSLSEIAILQRKKLWPAAARQLRKAKRLALETSRYAYALQCIEAELLHVKNMPPGEVREAFIALQQEEELILAKHKTLRELQLRHDSILALAQQFPFSRDAAIIEQAKALADADLVKEQSHSQAYLENALATNTLGICDLFLQRPETAIERYRRLLDAWKTKSEWQADQSDLLMTICKYYQNACFYSTVSPALVHSDLMALKGFQGLPPEKLRTFRETMFHHRFIHTLNKGNLDAVRDMIPEIEEWMKKESEHLSETQQLPFLCNFLVAEFLAGNYPAANKLITRIHNLPNRKTRVDIREFALVLQPVVQFELDNGELNEYLTRSRKRHFSKGKSERSFELTVLHHIGLLMRARENGERKTILEQFIAELQKLSEDHTGSIPLLGLNEIYMWAVARKEDRLLPDVFMDEVRKAHELADSNRL